ncbi:molybdopterin molybdotransferase MoeA [Glutamicibacter uratoxydans]|uniref:molybdopterin molybdotransferase MoeA n=1 Tax=Glutamicibacter uratoxydans TaxID=43667 RepID=UPI003D6EADB9
MALTPEEHLAWILTQVPTLPAQPLDLVTDFARLHTAVLAEDVLAAHPLPLWDNSAMDGYAVRCADLTSTSKQQPVILDVLGEVAAGSSWDPVLAPGQCVRIMTGAPLPTDADAVVRVEDIRAVDTQEPWSAQRVEFLTPVAPGKDIRRRGEDKEAADPVARAGQRLSAAGISSLAAAGVTRVQARPTPSVAVLITGSELQPIGTKLERGQIPESNSLLIRGLLGEAGISQITMHRCGDDPDSVRQQLRTLGSTHDVVISTGGVGPGNHDVMRMVLAEEPAVRAVRVAVRPGQPQCAGRLESGAMMFALPGNPVSAAVSFELFVRPALRAMQGSSTVQRPRFKATAVTGWRGAKNRLQVLPITFDPADGTRCLPAVQAANISHSVGGFGAAEGYALVGADRGDVAAGEQVEVIRVIG